MQGRPQGVNFRCLVTLQIGFTYFIATLLFIGALVLISAMFLVALAVALVALGVQRDLMALSPCYRERRVTQGPFQPTSRVMETSAGVIDSAKPKRRN
jgi:hypothetical protein